jgi:integrase
VILPILPEVRQLLDKRNGSFPRKISDQKYNDYIKEVCQLAGITEVVYGGKMVNVGTAQNPVHRKKKGRYSKYELVTSHIGRRSFATNYYGKIATPLLMSATGHASEKQFLDYIKRDPIDNALMLAKMFSKMNENE